MYYAVRQRLGYGIPGHGDLVGVGMELVGKTKGKGNEWQRQVQERAFLLGGVCVGDCSEPILTAVEVVTIFGVWVGHDAGCL